MSKRNTGIHGSFDATVIVPTYNKPEFLDKVLRGYEEQSYMNFEVIIADDGSGIEIKNLVDHYNRRGIISIVHVWHEDKGFRKNRVLNLAILSSRASYLIFADGDCIPHHHFVRDHLEFRAEHRVLAGRRVNLSEKISRRITPDSISAGKLKRFLPSLFLDSITGLSRDVEKGIFLPIKMINKGFGKFDKGVLGSNFSLYKKAMWDINGFDNRYIHPCVGEDSEPEFRLKLLAYEVFSPRFRLIQYHLFHKRLSRSAEGLNMVLFNETIRDRQIITGNGLKQLM